MRIRTKRPVTDSLSRHDWPSPETLRHTPRPARRIPSLVCGLGRFAQSIESHCGNGLLSAVDALAASSEDYGDATATSGVSRRGRPWRIHGRGPSTGVIPAGRQPRYRESGKGTGTAPAHAAGRWCRTNRSGDASNHARTGVSSALATDGCRDLGDGRRSRGYSARGEPAIHHRCAHHSPVTDLRRTPSRSGDPHT